MRTRRKLLLVVLSVIGLLSTAFAAPTFAFQEAEDDGQWCIDEGGIWDGANCEFTYEEWDEEQWCYDEGGTWDGTSCEFPYEEWDEEQWCYDEGGTWDGTSCEFPYEEWDEEQWCYDCLLYTSPSPRD